MKFVITDLAGFIIHHQRSAAEAFTNRLTGQPAYLGYPLIASLKIVSDQDAAEIKN